MSNGGTHRCCPGAFHLTALQVQEELQSRTNMCEQQAQQLTEQDSDMAQLQQQNDVLLSEATEAMQELSRTKEELHESKLQLGDAEVYLSSSQRQLDEARRNAAAVQAAKEQVGCMHTSLSCTFCL
jgi:chlorite dismutase